MISLNKYTLKALKQAKNRSVIFADEIQKLMLKPTHNELEKAVVYLKEIAMLLENDVIRINEEGVLCLNSSKLK